MTGLLKCRRYPTRGSLYFLLFILASTAATTMPVTARANDAAIDTIINHPAVAAARARVCQSASQYDLAVARERPQVDFSLRGGTSLTAYDVSRYGTLTGKVQKIANNSTQEENLPPYFVTLIKIPDPQFEQSGFAPEVVPGMTVIVDVLGGKRTVINYILSPIERAQSIAFREK